MNEEEYEDELYSENYAVSDYEGEESENEKKENIVETFKVYGIYRRETNKIVYVGRTKRHLNTRFREHQKSSEYLNKYIMDTGGFDKYGIEVLQECDNMSDSIDWESHLILEMEPSCNINGKYKEKPIKNWAIKKNWALISAIKKKYKKTH